MNDKQETPLYRIGDYARFMGVSTDLLKHYEKLGLIRSETAENGYRYYPFHESTALLECKRLQNYGLSLREMHQVLREAPFDEVRRILDSKIGEMEKQLKFQQLVIEEHRRISAWMEMMQDCETRIVIKETEPVFFLPQSDQRNFIQDERISALLESWLDGMPLVKSCCLIPAGSDETAFSWGLAATQSHLQALQLPVNDVVQRIEGGRYLHVHFRHQPRVRGKGNSPWAQIEEIIRQYDIVPGSSMLHFSLMRLGMDRGRINCGWFSVPLQAESAE